jgi:hypothetical protein
MFGFDNRVDTLWKKFFSCEGQETALYTKAEHKNYLCNTGEVPSVIKPQANLPAFVLECLH